MSIHDIAHSLLLRRTAIAAQHLKPCWTQFTWPRGDWSNPLWDTAHLYMATVAATNCIGLFARENANVALDFRDRETVCFLSQKDPRIITAAYRQFPPFDQNWRPAAVVVHVYDQGELRYLRVTDGWDSSFEVLTPGTDYPLEWCLSNPVGVQLTPTHHDFLGGKGISYQVSGKFSDKDFDRGRWLQYDATCMMNTPGVVQAAVCRAGETAKIIDGLPGGLRDVALLSFPNDSEKGYDASRYLIAALTSEGELKVYYADVSDESHWSPVSHMAIPGSYTRCMRLELWGREDLLLYNEETGISDLYHLNPADTGAGAVAGLRIEKIELTTGGDVIPKRTGLRLSVAGPFLGVCDTSNGETTIYIMDQSSPNLPAAEGRAWSHRPGPRSWGGSSA